MLVAEETLRIGSVDDPASSFTSFHALEEGPDGRIYTIHAQEGLIRVHAPDGAPLGVIGGPGEGPGEFGTPVAMGFRDGALWVWDMRMRRVSHFGPDGSFLRDEQYQPRTPEDPEDAVPLPEGLLADGSFFGSRPLRARDIASGAVTHEHFMRLRLDGTIIDTIAVRPVGGGTMVLSKGGQDFFVSRPFPDSPLFAMSPARMEVVFIDRTIRADDPGILVTKLAVGGDTLWSRRYAYEPVMLDAAAVDSVVLAHASRADRSGFMSLREAESAIREQLSAPPHWPGVRMARLGHDGSVWLALRELDPLVSRWLVIGADGDVVGQVALPERLRVITARENEVWGMDRDELDIPYIVRYEVRLSGPA